MRRYPLLNESEAGTAQISADGQALQNAKLLPHPTVLPYPLSPLDFVGETGIVLMGTYVFKSPVYNAQGGRGFYGQVPLQREEQYSTKLAAQTAAQAASG